MNPATRRLAERCLEDPAFGLGIGVPGAIAEFHRQPDEPVAQPSALERVTARGAIRLDAALEVRPVAWEWPGRHAGTWQQGLVFCADVKEATLPTPSGLTELGPDTAAVRPEDRDGVLFDLGLGRPSVTLAVRCTDPTLVATLRAAAGTSVFTTETGALAAILEHDPHRVALSRIGRIEVYQGIGREHTPDGPHTHLLPGLLATGRTHEPGMPVPAGQVPVLHVYPPHPCRGVRGELTTLDADRHQSSQALLEQWGEPDWIRAKLEMAESVRQGLGPGDASLGTIPASEVARVALAQVRAIGSADTDVLDAWETVFSC